MVVYDVKCGRGHVFEAWFAGSEAFRRQAKAGQVICPQCGSRRAAKVPMAPNIAARGRAPDGGDAAKAATALRALRAQIEKTCRYVGPRFAEEARKIHHRETKRQSIYGEATAAESRALRDEGVDFGVIPWLPKHDA